MSGSALCHCMNLSGVMSYLILYVSCVSGKLQPVTNGTNGAIPDSASTYPASLTPTKGAGGAPTTQAPTFSSATTPYPTFTPPYYTFSNSSPAQPLLSTAPTNSYTSSQTTSVMWSYVSYPSNASSEPSNSSFAPTTVPSDPTSSGSSSGSDVPTATPTDPGSSPPGGDDFSNNGSLGSSADEVPVDQAREQPKP